MKKYLGVWLCLLIFSLVSLGRAQPVSANATTKTVAYQVNKAGSDTPSLANRFFSGEATVTTTDDGSETVTLHLIEFASMIKTFSIGEQAAKITNATNNTADLTFTVDDSFRLPVVQASMAVMNMNQKVDLVFANALYQPKLATVPVAESPADTPSVPASSPEAQGEAVNPANPVDATQSSAPSTSNATDKSNVPAATESDQSTQTVDYQVNKVGTDTPSLANSFFSGHAVVAHNPGQADTVTLHLQKYAKMVKSFSIGDQAAKISNATDDTADLTFTIDASFAKPVVVATMAVMNMNQQADLVFTKALYQPTASEATGVQPQTGASTKAQEPETTASNDAPQVPDANQTPAVSVQSDATASLITATSPAITQPATVASSQSEHTTEPQTAATTKPEKSIQASAERQPTSPSKAPAQTPVATKAQTNQVEKVAPITSKPITEAVQYRVNKAGTDLPSLASSFFTGVATVTMKAGQPQMVTLHIQKYANVINRFVIGNQNAKITKRTADSADLTFDIDANFTKPTVTASISVMNMHQQADLVFAKALYQPSITNPASTPVHKSSEAQHTTVRQSVKQTNTPQKPHTVKNSTPNAVTMTAPDSKLAPSQHVVTTPSIQTKAQSNAATTTIAYQVNKVGTNTPSLANDFFTGLASVTTTPGQATTVTLHLQKHASVIKSFSIGGQAAKITNLTGDTADLTFNVDANFDKRVVAASMSVMNMHQQADLVFAKALYQPTGTTAQPTVAPKPSQTAVKAIVTPSNPSAIHQGQVSTVAKLQRIGEVSAKLYQAQNGQLTDMPSAAQQFIDAFAKVERHATNTTVTLHTTGAEYIKSMRIAGQQVTITNRHGANADLVVTLANDTLQFALPVAFSLSVPGAASMTQSAFLLLDLPIQTAHTNPQAQTLIASIAPTTSQLPTVARTTAHAINPALAQQEISYAVLDASGNAVSTANQYFTHSARVVKAGNGYDVYLTLRVTAGVVDFTPVSVNGSAVGHLTHAVVGGQDVWSFRFHIADAGRLDQLIPATIVMSVPMANISNQSFNINFAFARLAQANLQTAATPIINSSATTSVLKPITITQVAPKLASKTKSATQAAADEMKANQPLPKLSHYPIGWEALAFIIADALIILGAWFWRRRQRSQEVAHD